MGNQGPSIIVGQDYTDRAGTVLEFMVSVFQHENFVGLSQHRLYPLSELFSLPIKAFAARRCPQPPNIIVDYWANDGFTVLEQTLASDLGSLHT